MSSNPNDYTSWNEPTERPPSPRWVDYQWTGRAPGTHDSDDEDTSEHSEENEDPQSVESVTDDEVLATPRGAWVMVRGAYSIRAEPLPPISEDESDSDTLDAHETSPAHSTYDADIDTAAESPRATENEDTPSPPAVDWADEEYGYGYHTDRNPYNYTDDGSSDYSPSDDTASAS